MNIRRATLSILLLAPLSTVSAAATDTVDKAADPWAGKVAIVVAQGEVALMEGPTVVGTINNIWVQAIQSQGNWIWVETSDGTKGWIPKSKVLLADQAERILTERIAAEPRNPELYRLRGMVRGRDGRFDAEIVDVNTALRFAPDEHEYYNDRGQALVAKGEVAKGLADFEHGLRLNPGDEFLIYGAADAHYRLKQLAESLRHLDELVRLFPTRAYAYRSRGMVRSELNRPVDALVDYGQARRLDPKATTGLYSGLAQESIWWEDFVAENLAFYPPETIASFAPVDAIDWEIRAARGRSRPGPTSTPPCAWSPIRACIGRTGDSCGCVRETRRARSRTGRRRPRTPRRRRWTRISNSAGSATGAVTGPAPSANT